MRCEVFRSQLQNISILNHPTVYLLGLVTAKYVSAQLSSPVVCREKVAVCTRCCSAAVLQAELPRLAASVLSRRSAAAEFTRVRRA